MEYDAIILELMSRIKVMEEKCKEMEMRLSDLENSEEAGERSLVSEVVEEQEGTNVYGKMTEAMMDLCYEYGEKAYRNPTLEIGKLADEVSAQVAMNRSSAFIYIWAVKDMLDGKVYKRAISAKATERYFEKIYADYGTKGLKMAVKATKEHIAYRRTCGHTVDGLTALCGKYEQLAETE